jgi:tRNA (guanosine-2'-O-)-methyltransferase
MSEEEKREALITWFKGFVTPERWEKITAALDNRTRYLTVVLEDIFQPHNSSAVLRSCDGFGIQDVHIVENRNSFRISNHVALGSSRWLDIHRWREKGSGNTRKALESLKTRGYRIIATSPHGEDVDLEDFALERGKAAFIFGNELDGLSSEALDMADEYMKIPMHGFVESFNISVCCALVLHHLTWKLRQLDDVPWKLNEAEKKQLLLSWLRKSVRNSRHLEAHFLKEQPKA